MFLGAGSAATGMADLVLPALCRAGLSKHEALKNMYFVDQNGLVVNSREDLAEHNLPYAHDMEQMSFTDSIKVKQSNHTY